MKQGKIYLYDQYVGLLTEDETGFTFAYDADYLASDGAEAVSLTLPLSNEPYHDTVLFPFFDGLIPEGWLLNIAESSWKINQRDRMSLLLACCKDCIGAVSVIPLEESHAERTNNSPAEGTSLAEGTSPAEVTNASPKTRKEKKIWKNVYIAINRSSQVR